MPYKPAITSQKKVEPEVTRVEVKPVKTEEQPAKEKKKATKAKPKDKETKAKETAPVVTTPKEVEPEKIPTNKPGNNVNKELSQFMDLAKSLKIATSDEVYNKISNMENITPEIWEQFYDLMMDEYVNNRYCALCGSITALIYSENKIPQEIWEITIDLLESNDIDQDAKKIIIEALFSESNKEMPSELLATITQILTDKTLIKNWEGELKNLNKYPTVAEITATAKEVLSESTATPTTPNTIVDPEPETVKATEPVESKNIDNGTNWNNKLDEVLTDWNNFGATSASSERMNNLRTKAINQIKELIKSGKISNGLMEYLFSKTSFNIKEPLPLVAQLAIALSKLSQNDAKQLKLIKVLENELKSNPQNIEKLILYTNQTTHNQTKEEMKLAPTIFDGLNEAEIIKLFNNTIPELNTTLTHLYEEATPSTNKTLNEVYRTTVTAADPKEYAKTQESLPDFLLRAISNIYYKADYQERTSVINKTKYLSSLLPDSSEKKDLQISLQKAEQWNEGVKLTLIYTNVKEALREEHGTNTDRLEALVDLVDALLIAEKNNTQNKISNPLSEKALTGTASEDYKDGVWLYLMNKLENTQQPEEQDGLKYRLLLATLAMTEKYELNKKNPALMEKVYAKAPSFCSDYKAQKEGVAIDKDKELEKIKEAMKQELEKIKVEAESKIERGKGK